jgi:hypothetical protein
MSDDLEAAEATETELREQIAELVHARARADAEARRLSGRMSLPGAEASLRDIVGRWERQATVLGGEIDGLRASLRIAEAEAARLRAEAAGA